jgi:hypothetical protein
MLISLAFCAVISLVLAGLAGIVHWFKEPGTTDALKMSEDEIKNYNTGLIGGLVSAASIGCYTSRLKAQKVLRRYQCRRVDMKHACMRLYPYGANKP